MTVAPTSAPPVSAYPDPITLPVAPHGDPAAARALATAYRALADDLDACARQVDGIVADLGLRWRGQGSSALRLPQQTLDHNLTTLAGALRTAAGHLQDYATALHKAQHHHGWSLGKFVAIGAVVAITTVAVVVTVGAAAPVGTAAAVEVGEAIAGTEAAAGAATAAETAATTGLSLAGTAMTALRGLVAVAMPHLIQGGVASGIDAGLHLVTGHPIRPTELSEAFVAGTLGSATTTVTRNALHATETYAGASRVGQAALDTASMTATLTTDAALGEYARTGHLNPTALTQAALLTALTGGAAALRNPTAGTGAITSDVSGARPRGQTLAEIERDGITLNLHEGAHPLGHTLAKHVGKSAEWLKLRLSAEPERRSVSTFTDVATAEAAILDALRENVSRVLRVAAKHGNFDDFPTDLNRTLGIVMARGGSVRNATVITMKLVNVKGRIVVRTAFVGARVPPK